MNIITEDLERLRFLNHLFLQIEPTHTMVDFYEWAEQNQGSFEDVNDHYFLRAANSE